MSDPSSHNEFREVAWFHFQTKVPGDWEATAYSVEDRIGRVEFSTRHGFQGLVSWQPCRREPAVESMMISFLREQVPDTKSTRGLRISDLKTRRIGPFFVGTCRPDLPCQALHYSKNEQKLIAWTFPTSDETSIRNLYTPVLKSFDPNDGEWRHYALYGLNFQLPEEYKLEDMEILPANVVTVFESRKKARATFRRWGMPEMLLEGSDLSAFYHRILRIQRCVVRSSKVTTFCGMEAAEYSYDRRGEYQMDKLIGKFWTEGRAVAWHNREEKRIYAFQQIAPSKQPLLKIEDVLPHLFQPGRGRH